MSYKIALYVINNSSCRMYVSSNVTCLNVIYLNYKTLYLLTDLKAARFSPVRPLSGTNRIAFGLN